MNRLISWASFFGKAPVSSYALNQIPSLCLAKVCLPTERLLCCCRGLAVGDCRRLVGDLYGPLRLRSAAAYVVFSGAVHYVC